MLRTVVWRFVQITMPDADHKQKKVGPEITELIYKIATPDFAKKRSDNHQKKYEQQKAYKDQKGINCKKY